MVAIHVTDRAGAKKSVEAKAGSTLMEILRDKDIDVEAICGGCCSCATCHIYVDPAWTAKLPARTSDEQEMLQESSHYKPETSRLSCQVRLTDALNGIDVTVAPSD